MDEITSGMTAEETIPSPEESGEGNSFSEEVTSEETFESAESEEAPIEPDAPDYAAIVEEDVKELRESFPELPYHSTVAFCSKEYQNGLYAPRLEINADARTTKKASPVSASMPKVLMP